ncbi:hypothetical protein E1890_21575 [Salmonella enterica subsp. enterica serovar Mountpleasant]|nr:hypothetical protein [Salmonella enterica subsp. enterica serovar Mountpleasant]
MASWLDKARDNMLRYSSGQAWPAVMKEWSVTGGFIDSHSINKTCELCDNEGLRYQFQITNRLTHYSLWVGSTCINKFVPVFAHPCGFRPVMTFVYGVRLGNGQYCTVSLFFE